MLLIDDDQVVEAGVLQGPDCAVLNRVGAGRPHRAEQALLAPPYQITFRTADLSSES